MEFVRTVEPAEIKYIAVGEDDLIAVDCIEIKINQNTKFEAEVPEGKIWKVSVTVRAWEFDAPA